jgi:hypothetical protein
LNCSADAVTLRPFAEDVERSLYFERQKSAREKTWQTADLASNSKEPRSLREKADRVHWNRSITS